MPKLLSEIIQSVATKAGIPADSAELKAIVTNAEVMKVTVPDALATSFDSGIHSLESAESSLRTKLHAEAYNGVDAAIYELAKTEYGLDDEAIKPLKETKKTNERIKLLAGKVAELVEKKAGAAAPDKAKITEQINALNQKIADITKSHNEALAQKELTHLNEITSMVQDRSLSSHQFAMDVPIDVNITTAKQFLQKSFAKDGVKAVYDKAMGIMKLVKEDGTDFFNSKNEKVSYSDYEKAVLAENKLLKVADPAAGKGGQGGAGSGGSGGSGSGGHGNERNANFLAHMDAEIQSEGGK